jgi:hypothetical protein
LTTKPTALISELTFSGGNTFQINEKEKVILVGPNNSVKYHSLIEIISICQDGKTDQTLVVKGLKVSKKGTLEEFKSFLEAEADYKGVQYRYKSWQLHENHVPLWNTEYLTGQLLPGFIKNIAANDRLSICERQASISPGDQKTKPQHILYDDESLMVRISES